MTRPTPDPLAPGQENVRSFPRPAIAQPCHAHIVIEHAGIIVADSRATVRTLETRHPPSYYIPRDDIAALLAARLRARVDIRARVARRFEQACA